MLHEVILWAKERLVQSETVPPEHCLLATDAFSPAQIPVAPRFVVIVPGSLNAVPADQSSRLLPVRFNFDVALFSRSAVDKTTSIEKALCDQNRGLYLWLTDVIRALVQLPPPPGATRLLTLDATRPVQWVSDGQITFLVCIVSVSLEIDLGE